MDAALNATCLAAALLWRTVIGRVLRRTVERVAGAAPRFEHPLFDLLIGVLAGGLGFAVWSAVLKRALGVGAPSIAFAIAEVLAVAALAGWRLSATWPSAMALTPGVQTVVRAATFAALVAGLANADIVSFRSDNMDQDQHVAWTMETAYQGVVPDRYGGTDTIIDYPLGLHALAVSTASSLVSPAIVLNALPLLTTLLVVALVCGATASLALGGGLADTPAPRLELVLLEAGCVVALSLALFSGHFSVWPRYLVNPRQVAGLCHLVPVLACFGALMRRLPGSAGSAPGLVPPSAVLVTGLMASGALAAALNPVLVPLHAVLCGVALLAAALRRQVTWFGLGTGLAVGGALAVAVVASDPYLSRRANLPGLRPPAAPYLAAVQADFARAYTGRSCLTPACVGRALVSPVAFAVAREPMLALTQGTVELLFTPPAPLRYDRPAPGQHRFPDLTGIGLAPVHGLAAPYVFALLPWLFLAAILVTRNRRLLAAIGGVAAAIGIDAGIRGVLRALTDPGDPGLRLLPYYTDTAAAVLFTQVLWPLLLVGTTFTGAGRDSMRRRWLRLVAAAAVLVPLAVSAAGPVTRGMPWRSIHDGPSNADLEALARLEARVVPDGDSYLVAGRLSASSGERWIIPSDDAMLFYLHARRPTLFLYFLDHTARYGPAGLETTCAALQAGAGDTVVGRHRARWALAAASAGDAVPAVGRRVFCGRTLREWFPAMRAAGSDGRLTIVELWADPR
jgi:hypothetical protein